MCFKYLIPSHLRRYVTGNGILFSIDYLVHLKERKGTEEKNMPKWILKVKIY